MKEKLALSEGSYTFDCVLSSIYGCIDILCSECGKLIYRKEIDQGLDGQYQRRTE